MSDIHTLISPLGRSPGAVTGLYFALRQRGYNVQRVVTLGTSHPYVLKAAQRFIDPLLRSYDVQYDPIHLPARELKGGRKAVLPYANMMGVVINEAYQREEVIHISVTAGRSGMGALGALAAQFYGASHLWHFWVDEDIEVRGDVQDLEDLTGVEEMQHSKILNPTLQGEAAWDLVELPFMQLRPLYPVLKEYARTGRLPDTAGMVSATLLNNLGLSQQILREIYPAGITFQQADTFNQLATQYLQSNSQQERTELLMQIGAWMVETGVTDENDRRKLMRVLQSNGSPEALAKAAKKDRLGFWAFLREHHTEVATTLTTIELLLKILELYLKVNGSI